MYNGGTIDVLTAIVAKHEARLRENPPTEEEWERFLAPEPDPEPNLED